MKKKKARLRRALPSEITVGFEMHSPGFIEKKKEYMDRADIILLELRPSILADMKRWKPKDLDWETSRFGLHKKFVQNLYFLLKDQMKKGKTIIATDVGVNKADERVMAEQERSGYSMKSTEMDAISYRVREEERLKWILEHLRKFKGKKVLVDAGAIHTPLYHDLKRALKGEEKAGLLKIKREHLARGMFENKRILEKYEPEYQTVRMHRFKKKLTRADKKRLDELAKQHHKFEMKLSDLSEKYRKQGLGWEDAEEKARFELLRKQRRKGLTK